MEPASQHTWNLFQHIRKLGACYSIYDSIRKTKDWSEAESHNTQYSHLYILPAELLGIIHQHLTPEDSFALSLTCARFYYSSILADVQHDLKSTKMGHFITMCMLEGVGQLKGYCCRGCLTTHPSSDFSKDELQKRHAERYCLRTKKVLKIRQREYSFNDIQSIRKEQKLESRDVPEKKNIFLKLFSSPKVSIVTAVRLFPSGKKVSAEQFAELCLKLNYPVCSHMTTADKRIADLYVPGFFKDIWGTLEEFKEYIKRNEQGVKCNVCNTIVTMTVSYRHGLACAIIIIRPIGRLVSPLEPAWMAMASSSSGGLMSEERADGVQRSIDEFWAADETRLSEVAPPAIEANCRFVPLSLPKSSWMARLGVTAWSAVSSWIPEDIHRKSGHVDLLDYGGKLLRTCNILKFDGRRQGP